MSGNKRNYESVVTSDINYEWRSERCHNNIGGSSRKSYSKYQRGNSGNTKEKIYISVRECFYYLCDHTTDSESY